MVAGRVNSVGDHRVCLGDEAGEGVQPDRAVAEPVGGAQGGEGIDGLGEDGGAVGVGAWRGQFTGFGQAQRLATGFYAFDNILTHGAYQQQVIHNRPGYWVLACFMDTQDHREHTTLGMERVIHIVK